jgi:hypothetical protein
VKPAIFGVSALAVVFLGSVCLAADQAGKAQPSGTASGSGAAQTASDSGKQPKSQAAKGQPKASRLTKPWKDMASLTEEQKKQIADIHRKAVQDKNVIEEREEADIMALLNDQQKAELKSMRDKETVEKKTKAGNRPAAKGGATEEKAAENKAGEKEAAGQNR